MPAKQNINIFPISKHRIESLWNGLQDRKFFKMFLQSGKSQLAKLPSRPLIFMPGALEEFTPFSQLSLELRLKIWRLAALSHARVFELVWCSSEDDLYQLFKVSKQTNCVPPIMEVNREAREEGMRIFEKRVFNNCNIDIGSPFKVEGEKRELLHVPRLTEH
ncbi:hypothetical protein BCON_0274g00120 [Botryotinia convoluta]|uniref:2EXR domain-containing protein n=1 Tax=Botryotinia convoluta TaxID=54673 RepID=A0A4Z1HRE3_9HELO|nr:hypothetical protein BCON_0274g00120 [Botryotinia convoluta]